MVVPSEPTTVTSMPLTGLPLLSVTVPATPPALASTGFTVLT